MAIPYYTTRPFLVERNGWHSCVCVRSHHHPVFLSPCVRLLCWRTSSIPSNHRCKRLACVRYFFFWFLFWPLTHETLLFNDPEPSSSTGRASEPDWVLGAFTPTNLQSTCNTIFREESLCFFPFFYFPPFFKKRSVGGGVKRNWKRWVTTSDPLRGCTSSMWSVGLNHWNDHPFAAKSILFAPRG